MKNENGDEISNGKESTMIFSGITLVGFVVWIAERLGFGLELPEDLLAESVDERAVFEQLAYGRD